MKPARWIGGAVGVLFLSCVLNSMFILLLSPLNTQVPVFVGGLIVLAGIVISVVMIVRYVRAPQEKHLVCQQCALKWSPGDAIEQVEWDLHQKAGVVILPIAEFAPGTYNHEALGLTNADECVYCGQPATQVRHEPLTHNNTDADGKVIDSWTFNLEFPYCDEHARIAKRNENILYTAFGIGFAIGVALVLLWVIPDPEAAIRAVGTPLSWFINSVWMGFLAIIAVFILMCVFVGFIVQVIVIFAAGFFVKTLRDQHGEQLGVGAVLNFTAKEITLSFTRPESAEAYLAVNGAVIAALHAKKVAVAKAEALAAIPEMQVAAQTAREVLAKAGETCWFCDKGVPADGTPHNVVLYQGEKEARIEEVVWVARCQACEKVHKSNAPIITVGGTALILLFMVLCVVIGLVGTTRFVFWRWLVGVIVAFAGAVGAFLLVVYITKQRAEKAGTRVVSDANQLYAVVKEKIDAGWKLDAVKTSNTK